MTKNNNNNTQVFTDRNELRTGVDTPLGVIDQVSMTAVRIGSEWHPIGRLVVSAPVSPLVRIGAYFGR